MWYRIFNQVADIQAASLLIPVSTHTRGHANNFLVPYCSVNAYIPSTHQYSSLEQLPAELIIAPSLDVFKTRIKTAVLQTRATCFSPVLTRIVGLPSDMYISHMSVTVPEEPSALLEEEFQQKSTASNVGMST